MNRRNFLKDVMVTSTAITSGLRMSLASVSQPVIEDAWLTGNEVIRLFRSKALDLVEYTDMLLARAQRLRDYNIFITLDSKGALQRAKDIQQQINAGQQSGPLYGLPYVLKDNINTANLPTTGGTPALRDWIPPKDAEITKRINEANGVLFGKVNMHELAYGITSNNATFGPVRNPYDRTKIPGGSSGGTAAAIAAGIVPFGMGSDTGGSCRIPAALCGCVGFRPSVDRYVRTGVIPISHTQDTPGPLGRTVDDVILLDQACMQDNKQRIRQSLKGLRLGIPREYYYQNLDPSLEQVINTGLGKLGDAGVELVEVSIANVRQLSGRASLVAFESVRELAAYLWQNGSNISLNEVIEQIADPRIKQRMMIQRKGEVMLPVDYREAVMVHRPRLRTAYQSYFKDNKLSGMLIPTTPLPARDIGLEDTVELNGKQVPTFGTFARNTGISSGAGVPCLSIPAGLADGNLPVGMELVGPFMSDVKLLEIGREIEATLGRLPPPRV